MLILESGVELAIRRQLGILRERLPPTPPARRSLPALICAALELPAHIAAHFAGDGGKWSPAAAAIGHVHQSMPVRTSAFPW